MINGFFNWATGMRYIEKKPCPNTKLMPQFRIEYDKPEVQPPATEQITKVINAATGKVKLLLEFMRWTGMALVDAVKFGMTAEDCKNHGMSKPDRRPTIQGTLIRGNRTMTNERYRVRISESLAKKLQALGSPAFPDTYTKWRDDCYKAFRAAKVDMTPHRFRHFRISELLSQGMSPNDVADMVGTSEKEIRRTYAHWIKEREDRLDEVQRQAWLKQGLDANGNEVVQ